MANRTAKAERRGERRSRPAGRAAQVANQSRIVEKPPARGRRRFRSPDSRFPTPDSRLSTGFTLIELLVVVVIVGVLALALTLAVAGNAERQLESEAERFRALLAHACGQAELTGREIGLVLGTDGYAFRRLEGDTWREPAEDELRARRWPGALRLELSRGGRPLELASPERDAPQLVCFSSGELTPFSLTLALGDAPQRYRVSGEDDGTLTLERVAAPR